MYSFNVVIVYDLLDRGRIEIGDLPDPQAEMTDLLDNLAEAIRTLNDDSQSPGISVPGGPASQLPQASG